MLGNKPPYTTMQQLNLDWVLSKLKTLLRLVPDDGAVGQILRRTRDGAVWSDEQGGGGGGAVESVNGKTGAVVLDAADVGALPDDYTPPVTSVNGKTGAVVLGKSDVGLVNVDNVKQYSATNPPPYPVTSVNGKTGAVVLGKSDVGLVNVDNVKQYSATNPPPYPVTSVNGQTGAVVIPAVKLVDIPQSAFTWNGGTSSFYCSDIYSAVPQLTSVPVGFFVFFTNGSAISGTRLQGNSLYVMGWIPNSSQSISSGYTFNCVAILKE